MFRRSKVIKQEQTRQVSRDGRSLTEVTLVKVAEKQSPQRLS